LRNLRATIIPGLAIPTSIISTFAIMYFLGFSINNFTLLALTIAIGIVVDDAIIVLENAYRHQEELHESPHEAAVRGSHERGFTAITEHYRRLLDRAVHHRGVVLAGAAATVLLAYGLFRVLKKEFVPQDDRGYIVVFAQGPEGATLPYMDAYQRQLEQIISRTKDVEGYFSFIGYQSRVSQGIMFV